MTESTTGTGDIPVTSNAVSAPVEQKSTEIELPKSREQRRLERSLPSTPDIEVKTEEIKIPESIKAEPSAEDKANQVARQALQERMRAEDAERRLKEMTPKAEISDKIPDINDKSTWGKKYQDAPNDLDTFLKARDEWAEAQGEKKALDRQKAESAAQALQKQRVEIAARDEAARKKFSDYDSIINPIVPIIASNPILKDFVIKNPMGSEVAYELGRNPAVLQTLLQNPDIWSIGEQLISMAARLKAPKPVEITKAPEPITPVGSRETARINLTQLASKDTAAYIAEMNKRELKSKFRRVN